MITRDPLVLPIGPITGRIWSVIGSCQKVPAIQASTVGFLRLQVTLYVPLPVATGGWEESVGLKRFKTFWQSLLRPQARIRLSLKVWSPKIQPLNSVTLGLRQIFVLFIDVLRTVPSYSVVSVIRSMIQGTNAVNCSIGILGCFSLTLSSSSSYSVVDVQAFVSGILS